MNYLIIGNIYSGKSTLAKMIADKKDMKIIKLDDCRKVFNPESSDTGERISWEYFARRLEEDDNTIFEYTGCSKHNELAKRSMKENDTEFRILQVQTPIEVCLSRCAVYGNRDVPMPYDFMDTKKSIKYIDKTLNIDKSINLGKVIEIVICDEFEDFVSSL